MYIEQYIIPKTPFSGCVHVSWELRLMVLQQKMWTLTSTQVSPRCSYVVGIEPYGISRINFRLSGLLSLFGTINLGGFICSWLFHYPPSWSSSCVGNPFFFGSHNNEGILICGLVCVNISFFFLTSSPISCITRCKHWIWGLE